jgi:hypothetical protein
MSLYSLTCKQQKFLDDFEHEFENFVFEPEEPTDPKTSHENALYNLIWSKVRLGIIQERAKDNRTQPPWSFFRLLEREWNLEAPHPSAFQALAQLPTAANFRSQRFIQSQHQNIVAKMLASSVAWWFATYSSRRSTKSFDFSPPSDTLIASLVKYNT